MSDNILNLKVDRIFQTTNGGATKAFVDLSINEVLVIKGFRVVDGKNGLFVSLPQEQGKDKRWYDNIRCLSNELRFEIDQKILSAYNESLKAEEESFT